MSEMNILLFGGGLDSTVLAVDKLSKSPLKDLHCVHVDYGQKAADKEREHLNCLAQKYLNTVPIYLSADLSFSNAAIMRDSDKSTQDREANMLALRNPFLISLVASWAVSTMPFKGYAYTGEHWTDYKILLGFHFEPDDTFPDAQTGYLDYLAKSLTMACNPRGSVYKNGLKQNIQIVTPYSTLSRQDIFNIGMSIDPEMTQSCYSCYEQSECGICTHCVALAEMKREYMEASK